MSDIQSNTLEIDYHALAAAQYDFPDNESDLIAASIPDDLKNHVSKLYDIPARGSIPGPQRLAVAHKVKERMQGELERRARVEAEQKEQARFSAAVKADHALKQKLGLPLNTDPREFFSAKELQEWTAWLDANKAHKVSEFLQEHAKRRVAARVANPVRPSFL